MQAVDGQYGFDPIFHEDSKEEEKLAVSIVVSLFLSQLQC